MILGDVPEPGPKPSAQAYEERLSRSAPKAGGADARLLNRLSSRIREEAATSGGRDPMVDLFNARFPIGARLPSPSGFDSAMTWRADSSAAGPGWRSISSWREAATAARQAGRGGFALLHFADSVQAPMGIHVGFDSTTLWLFEARAVRDQAYRPLDERDSGDLPRPAKIAVIDYCADVRVWPGN